MASNSNKLNRKQRAERARLRNTVLNLEPFSTADWNIEDWQRLPSPSDSWTATPDLKRFFIVRIKSVRFSTVSRRFYQVVARPETRREWQQLRERAKQLVEECHQELTSQIVRDERRFIKQPRRKKR